MNNPESIDSAAAKAGVAAGRDLQIDPESEYAFALYQSWLKDCVVNHEGCPGIDPVELPTRILEVMREDGSYCLHLVQQPGLMGCYATLSYCWGSHTDGPQTKTSSLAAYLEHIEAAQLPKTIYDAVKATRGLGIRYLWVDRLCIIQDDTEDWEREASQMDAIYHKAHLTIAASAAKDGRDGCLFPRQTAPNTVVLPFQIQANKEKTAMKVRIHQGSIPEAFSQSPLNHRGWCLQESVLSQRILHFHKDRLVWQCKESLTSEDYINLRRGDEVTVSSQFSKMNLHINDGPELDHWYRIVNDYSRRKLSKDIDKLYAIAGLAHAFKAARSSNTYFAGIWDYKPHQGLLWISADGQMRDSTVSRAPSWSWAALEGPVDHLHILQGTSASSLSRIEILRFGSDSTSPTSASASAQPLSGGTKFAQHTLILQATKKPIFRSDYTISAAQFSTASSKTLSMLLYDRHDMQAHFLLNQDGESCGWVMFDQESFVLEDMFCVLICTVRRGKEFKNHNVLVVKCLDPTETVCKRLGAGEILEEHFFDDAQTTCIIFA